MFPGLMTCALALCAQAAAPVSEADLAPRVVATHVRVEPPEHFVPSKRFSGYEHRASGAALVVNELPGPAEQVQAGFDDDAALRTQGLRLLSKRDVVLGEDPGRLFRVDQSRSPDGPVEHRWMLVFGDAETTFTLLASWPDGAKMESALEGALLTARWDRAPIDPFEGLGMQLEPAPDAPFAGSLKYAGRAGSHLVFTRDGKWQQGSEAEPFFTFGPTRAPSEAPEDEAARIAHARSLLASAGEVGELWLGRSRGLEVDGFFAVEQVCDAKGLREGTPLSLYQFVIFVEGKCYRGVGTVARPMQREFMTAFHEWSIGFRRVVSDD